MFIHLRLILFVFLLLSSGAQAEPLKILTSFPPSLPDPFVQLFTAQNPEHRLQVLSKNTIAGIDEVLRGNKRNFDVFWSSSPEAFALLQQHDAFVPLGACGADGPPPVASFALSAVGWARRKDSRLFMPAEWNDLLRPLYRGKLAMARPARSGSTHMIVEQILQERGWDEGWAYLLELSGNLSTLTARSFGVPDGLVNRRFDIGLTIDFLAQSRDDTLDFRYGRPLFVVPAQIGILRQGNARAAACRFVEIVLSRGGQMTLLTPEISRVPFDPVVREEVRDRLPTDILDALRLPWLRYDAKTSAGRYWTVNTIFDLMITEHLDQRRSLWRRFDQLERLAAPPEMAMIRDLLRGVFISESQVADLPRMNAGLRMTSLVQLGPEERSLTEEWRARIARDLAAVEQVLSALEARHHK